MRAQRSVTSAAEVGRNIMATQDWSEGCQMYRLWGLLDFPEHVLDKLTIEVAKKLPGSLQECAQLEREVRESSNMGNIAQQKRRLDTSSAESSDNLAEADVQLAWGYVLRQLKQVGAQHVQWYLHDTSSSGITGHSGKVDYCMTADRLKAWPQVVALIELKKEIDSASLYGECIGQLSARTLDLFGEQPNRKHVVVIAGGSHSMEVLQFHRTYEVVRSGKQSFSLDATSAGFRWLIKALCSSLPSMGFIPEVLPFNKWTPGGHPIQKGLYCRADATTSAGLGLCCKVFQAEYDVGHQAVAVKIGASTKREVRELARHLAFCSCEMLCYTVFWHTGSAFVCFYVVPSAGWQHCCCLLASSLN